MASTNYDGRYQRHNFLGVVDVTRPYDRIFKPGRREQTLDALDQKLVEMMHQIKTSTPYMFNADESFTTVVFDHYGTTSPWWLVLMYNGLETPMQIQPGMVLNFPARAEVDSFIMNLVAPNRIGQIVTI